MRKCPFIGFALEGSALLRTDGISWPGVPVGQCGPIHRVLVCLAGAVLLTWKDRFAVGVITI